MCTNEAKDGNISAPTCQIQGGGRLCLDQKSPGSPVCEEKQQLGICICEVPVFQRQDEVLKSTRGPNTPQGYKS